MRHRRLILMTVAGALTLIAAACSGGGNTSSNKTPTAATTATSTKTTPAASATMAAMPMQPDAEKMKVSITAPQNGTKVTENKVTLQVSTTGFDDTCDLAGKPVQAGKGHYHIEIDKSLVNMFCTPQATVSMQNVKPGTHTLTVIPAQNDHAEVEANAVSFQIDYQPTSALTEIKDKTFAAKPSVKIISPKAGDTVSGTFDVTIDVQNFNLSCDLYGKPGVAGYGHWHLNFDSTSGPMMGMGTMGGMSCEKTFKASTTGFKSGEKHTLIALLVDNGHAPLMPEIEDKVEVTIK